MGSSTIPLFTADVVDLGAEPDRDTWCSPPEVGGALERFCQLVHGSPVVGLDPCTNERSIIRARIGWTRDDAPTSDPIRPWLNADGSPIDDGGYCNWRWSDPEAFVRACAEEVAAGHIAWVVGCGICDPSVGWWKHVWKASAICFPDHRVQFLCPPGAEASSNPHAIALPLWLPEPSTAIYQAFERAFSPLGKVLPIS